MGFLTASPFHATYQYILMSIQLFLEVAGGALIHVGVGWRGYLGVRPAGRPGEALVELGSELPVPAGGALLSLWYRRE